VGTRAHGVPHFGFQKGKGKSKEEQCPKLFRLSLTNTTKKNGSTTTVFSLSFLTWTMNKTVFTDICTKDGSYKK
jgi:hypothetical protein